METFWEEKNSVRWQRIKTIALSELGSLKNKRVVELGSGMGTYAALFAAEGAKVTLVDYSPAAIQLAKKFFNTLGIRANFEVADIFKLPAKLLGSYDVSVSCGVAEHFWGQKRKTVLNQHFNVLKSGGMTLVMVPNAANLPYRAYKQITESLGVWPWGEEYPYRRSEFVRAAKRLNIIKYGFFGDSFLWSLNYCNPVCLLSKKWRWFRRFNLPQTVATPFDERCAYSLGFWGIKQ
jgi:2-polyprenyl-3-methyl-5-hydroxy-6-metoxy-1,4-benzoquinol methylase